MTPNSSFWSGKSVLVTGHTGFKGAWLSLWLERLGAAVTGFALPPTSPSLFESARVGSGLRSVEGDVRDLASVLGVVDASRAEIIFHLAAQALVRPSYDSPVETFATNVMGTVHMLEAIRCSKTVRAVVVVTSDKCYRNNDWDWGYREADTLGGHDPYSSSKAAAELVTQSYRDAFFLRTGAPAVASARAGNVIGGGDWARDRLIPDAIRAFQDKRPLRIRNPAATRPWQHVLDPLGGYLRLAQSLYEEPGRHAEAWNFGPDSAGERSVRDVVGGAVAAWGSGASWEAVPDGGPHEARLLKLDSSKARSRLGWRPRLPFETSLSWAVGWYRDVHSGEDARESAVRQIKAFEDLP